jgi:hypothetical protein
MIVRLHLEPMDNSDSFIGSVDGDDGHISFKLLSDTVQTVLGFHGESLFNSFSWPHS